MSDSGLAGIVWGKVTLAAATVTLAIAGGVGGEQRPWGWILGSAGFIIVHTAVSARRDRSIIRRLGRDYDRVQRRVVQVLSELGELSADKYELWMIDLYLPEWQWSLVRTWPFFIREQQLSRSLAISLIDVRPQPPIIKRAGGPHWECFTEAHPMMWFEEHSTVSAPDNLWARYDIVRNADLAGKYGVLSVAPLVDALDRNCVGVLAVHVRPEPETVLQALGALQSERGRHRIRNACVDLNGLLGG